MRLLLTGATGYIGYQAVRRLMAQGHAVQVLLRPDSAAERLQALASPPVLHRAGGGSLAAVLAAAAPEAVLHLAFAPGNADAAAVAESIGFSLHLLEAAAARPGLRFVNVGSWWQFDAAGRYRPNSLYAAAKQAVQDLLAYYADRGLSACTALLYDVYGPGDWRRKLVPALLAAADGPVAATAGTQPMDLLHVDDVVDGLAALAAQPQACGLYTLGSGRTVTPRQVAAVLERQLGRPLQVAWGEIPFAPGQPWLPCPADRPPPGWAARVTLEDGLRQVAAQHKDGSR